MPNYLAQAIGFFGFLILIIVFQTNKRRNMLSLKILASIFWAVHFALLGAWTGSVMNVIGAARNYIFKQRTNKTWADNRLWLILFIVIFLISIIFSWEGSYSLLPATGMVVGTTAFWMKNTKHIRYLTLIASPLWLIYNIIVNSYAGILTEIFTISSVLIGIVRFDALKSNKEVKN